MVTRVASLPSRLLKGKDGEVGKQGPQGIAGGQGPKGKDGAVGRSPDHEIKNGEIRFLQPDGEWGEWLSVTSPSGGGKISNNTYTAITSSTYSIARSKLDLGTNIFGVRVTPATILIPNKMDSRAILIIKDEVGNAGSNNITIKVET